MDRLRSYHKKYREDPAQAAEQRNQVVKVALALESAEEEADDRDDREEQEEGDGELEAPLVGRLSHIAEHLKYASRKDLGSVGRGDPDERPGAQHDLKQVKDAKSYPQSFAGFCFWYFICNNFFQYWIKYAYKDSGFYKFI